MVLNAWDNKTMKTAYISKFIALLYVKNSRLTFVIYTALKVFVFGVFLVRTFSHSD